MSLLQPHILSLALTGQKQTIIGLSLAASTFVFGLLADVTLSPQLFLVKNALAVASAPLEVLISILYWSLRTIDPRLVLPDFAPPLSLSDDMSFHAVPALLLVTDLLFLSPPWTISALPAIGLSAFIAFGYWFWVELCYTHNGYYPYPLFEQLQMPYRIGLFAGSALVMSCSTWCLKWLYERVNGRSIEEGVEGEEKSRPGDVKRG